MNFVVFKDLWLKKDQGMPKQSFSHQTDRSNVVKKKCDSMCVVSVQSVFVIHYSLCLSVCLTNVLGSIPTDTFLCV